MKYSIKFAYMCEKYRKRRKLTQQELADMACVSLNCVKGFENGRNSPSIENFCKIFRALELDLCMHDRNYKPK